MLELLCIYLIKQILNLSGFKPAELFKFNNKRQKSWQLLLDYHHELIFCDDIFIQLPLS